MADINRRITISAQDNGVETLIGRLKNSASTLGREMIRDVAEQVEGGKEMVRIIEEQISAIERRSKLDRQSDEFVLNRQKERGDISDEDYKERKAEIAGRAEEDTMQTRLLRELIETVKDTAREEARDDSVENQRVLSAITSEGLKEDIDEFDYLRAKFAQDQIKNVPDDPEEQQQQRQGGDMTGLAVAQASRAIVSRNEVYALAGLLTALPLVGNALSSLVQKSFGGAEQLQQSRGQLQALSGDYVGNMGRQAENFGISMATFMSQYAIETARAQGSIEGVEQQGMDIVALERGFGLNRSTLLQLMRSSRNDAASQDIMSTVGTLFESLMQKGLVNENDFTLVEEYLQIANELASQQNVRLDQINTSFNTSVIAALGSIGGSFSDPQVLRQIVSTIDQSLQNPQSEYAQALQFATLSRLNPGASRVELMQMQEQGIAQPGLLEGLLSQFATMSGDNVEFMTEQVKAMFPGLSFAQANRLSTEYMSGELDLPAQQEFDDQVNRQYVTGDIATQEQMRQQPVVEDQGDQLRQALLGRAGLTTGYLQRETTQIDNLLAEKGDELSRQIGSLVNNMGGIEGAIGGLMDAGINLTEAINTAIGFFNGGKVPQARILSNKPITID